MAADLASAAVYGHASYQDYEEGNYWGAVGNLAGAALSVGGFAAGGKALAAYDSLRGARVAADEATDAVLGPALRTAGVVGNAAVKTAAIREALENYGPVAETLDAQVTPLLDPYQLWTLRSSALSGVGLAMSYLG